MSNKKTYHYIALIMLLLKSLTINSQSELWGVTTIAGNGFGSLFSMPTGSTGFSFQHDFPGNLGASPQSTKLLLASNGKLYGMTQTGGVNNVGVIFEYDINTGTYTKKFSFSTAQGSLPKGSLIEASNGRLYGMTSSGGANSVGVLFEYDITTDTYTKKIDLLSIDGGSPWGSLVELSPSNGKLYGMTRAGGANSVGTIFEYDLSTGVYLKKIDLSTTNGSAPQGDLVQVGSLLYGFTSGGGVNSNGTIFEYDYNSNVYTKKIDMLTGTGSAPNGSPLLASDGNIYGLASSGGTASGGVLFQYIISSNMYSTLVDLATSATGASPQGSLIQAANGRLYGLTRVGGANSGGVLFEFEISTLTYSKRVELVSNPSINGVNPLGTLIQLSSGKIYGLTSSGGSSTSGGVLFEYDPATSTYTKKTDLNYAVNGSLPVGGLIYAANGKIYGATSSGGTSNVGTIFECDRTAVPTPTIIKKFDMLVGASTGITPVGAMVEVSNGKLYGLATGGGSGPGGTIYEYDYITSTFTKKIDLISSNGSNPQGSMIRAVNGLLYGLTRGGGLSSNGVLFEYDPTANSYAKKIDFTGSANGRQPNGSLLEAPNGKLYGLTQTGGTANVGVIFEYDISTNTLTKKFDFSTGATTGSLPLGSLVLASDGFLYGIASAAGTNSMGVLFQYDYVNNVYTKKIDFSTTTGGSPQGSLVKSTSGKLYGQTTSSGVNGLGTIFEYDVTTSTLTKLMDLSAATGGSPTLTRMIEVCLQPVSPGTVSAPSGTLCAGDATAKVFSISTVPHATSYTWTLPSGASITSGNNTNVINTDYSGVAVGAHTFSVNATNVCGTSSASTHSVNIVSSPTITITVNNATICSGDSFTISPIGAATYTFSGGSSPIVSPTITTNYSVTGTGTNGCQSTNTVVALVNVDALPTIMANATSSAVCIGGTVALSGSGASTYTWAGGINDGVAFSPTVTSTYTVMGTGTSGCSNTATRTIPVNTLPAVTATSSTNSLCVGGSVTLNGNGATSYAWTNGVSDAAAFSPTVTNTYTVTGTDANGCSNTATRGITVNPLPAVTATSSTNSLCVGGSVTLNGNGATSYAWTNGVSDAAAFSPTVTNTYTVTGTDANGCSNTATRGITVNPLPAVTATSSTNSLCVGGTVTLNGNGATGYAWTNGVSDAAAFSPTVTNTYTVTGTDANGCSNTATRGITVNPLPAVTATSSTNSLCVGGSVTLNGNGATSYAWTNGVSNATAFSPTVTNTYTVTGTDANGCSNNATRGITVNPLPAVTATSSTNSLCVGGTVTLNGNGATGYAWTNGVSDAAAFSPTVTNTYTVTGTDANGCSNTATRGITVNPLPAVTATSSTNSLCVGGTVTLNGNGATGYAWTNGVSNATAFSPTVTNTYTVTGTDANGCSNTATRGITVNPLPAVTATSSTNSLCVGGSVTLNGNGATGYAWTNGVSNATAFSPTVTNTYTVTGTDANGCSNTATRGITVNPLPAVTATSSTNSLCVGGTVTLNGNGATGYAWTNGVSNATAFSPTVTNTYTVTGTDANGCSNTATRGITVNPLPAVTATSSTNSLCIGGTVTLNGNGATSYVWTNAVSNGAAFSPTVTNTYTVTGTDANGCSNTATRGITVNPLPAVTATSSTNSLCVGGTVTLNGNGATSYVWTNAVSNGAAFSPTVTNTYTVTGTNANGCSNTATRGITVNPLPAVTATSSANSLCIGGTVTLNGNGATSYVWTNGVSNGAAFSPTVTNTYTVTGTDANGCSNTAVRSVTVNSRPVVSGTASNLVVCSGATTSLNGGGAVTYTWTGGALNGVSFTPTATASYSVTGTNSAGCTSTNTAFVSVTVEPRPTIIVSSGAICQGNSYTIIALGAASYTYGGGTNVVTPTLTTSYTVAGTGTNGCVSASPVVSTVTVNTLPVLTISGANTVCLGSSITLSASGANSYSWGASSGATLLVSPTVTTTYSVVGTDTNNCSATSSTQVTPVNAVTITANSGVICPGDTYTIVPSGAATYTFSGGSPLVSPTVTSTYSITGTNSLGCVAVNPAVVTVTVVNAVTVTVSGNTTICSGQNVTLTASGATGYQWLTTPMFIGATLVDTPLAGIVYTVVGISGPCSDSSAVVVIVNPLPTVIAVASKSVICVNESVTLSASGAVTYSWLPLSSVGASITVFPASSTAYTVEGIDANNCINTAIVNMVVEPCVGIYEQTEHVFVRLYPNPNLGEFVIESRALADVSIHNVLGEVVMNFNLQAGANTVNMGHCAKGIYFVKINTGSDSRTVKVIRQ